MSRLRNLCVHKHWLCYLVQLSVMLYFCMGTFTNSSISDVPEPLLRKGWISYLQYSVQETLVRHQHLAYLSYYHDAIYMKVDKLIAWCQPKTKFPMVKHIEQWIPCGFAQLQYKNATINTIVESMYIKTHKLLYIVINFTHFTMDDSGGDCRNSFTALGQHVRGEWSVPTNWRFCGQRRPWYEVSDSNFVLLVIRQVNLREAYNIIFLYTAVDIQTAELLDLSTGSSHTLLQDDEEFTLDRNILGFTENLSSYNWLIIVEFGYTIKYLSLQACCYRGSIDIFDGVEDRYLLRKIEMDEAVSNLSKVTLVTTYYQSYVDLHIVDKNFMQNKSFLFKLNTIRVKHELKHLGNNGRSINVKHNGIILYDIFVMKQSETYFLNLSFIVRKFKGFNEGGCNLGGYALKHFVNHSSLMPVLFGPYCDRSTSNAPLIDGMKHIVLTAHQTHLIFYAYGPFYEIDITIIVTSSNCEGILEAVFMCPFNLRKQLIKKKYPNTKMMARNHMARCVKVFLNNIMIDLQKGCVIVQSVGNTVLRSYNIEIIGHMHLRLNCLFPQRPGVIGRNNFNDKVTVTLKDESHAVNEYNLVDSINISTRDLTYAEVLHFLLSNFDHPAYTVHLTTIPNKFLCANITDDTHLNTTFDYFIHFYITDYCGKALYHKSEIYQYTCRIQTVGYTMNHKNVMYVVVDIETCEANIVDRFDVITLRFRDLIDHSLDVIGNKTLNLLTHDTSVIILFDKAFSCSSYTFQYRVESPHPGFIHAVLSVLYTFEEIMVCCSMILK